MNYYEHHIGDYAQATGHLTMLEDAAYSRMIRWYYADERPLPGDVAVICRFIRATSKQEKDAVKSVLAEFFDLREDGYHQARCDAEIERFLGKSTKAKRSAEKRWNAHRAQSEGNANASPNAMRTHSEGNALQTPDTRHQTPEDSEAKASGAVAPPQQASLVPIETAEPRPMTARERVWAMGVALLGESARGLLGKLSKAYGEEALAAVLAQATLDRPAEPKAWVVAACEARKSAPTKTNGHDAKPGLLDDPTPEWALQAGFPNRFLAENEGCNRHNAAKFRDGRRIAQ